MGATATPSPSAGAPVPASSGAPPSTGTSPPTAADAAPCRTLYLRNLCEKPSKPRLRSLLHALCTPHGEVTWIVAEKTVRLRGQAFVTFADLAGATLALRKLQGTEFLSRRLVVAYARVESDRARPAGALRGAAKKARKSRKRAAPVPVEDDPAPPAVQAAPAVVIPHHVLFAEAVPAGEGLRERCRRLAGFQEMRPVPGKEAIAFLDFADEGAAAVAVSALDGLVLVEGAPPLHVVYAKK